MAVDYYNSNNNENAIGIMSLGSENNAFTDKICAFLLAVSPILQHYRGVYENAGFTVLLMAMPFLFICLFKRNLSKSGVMAIMPLLIFELYTALDHPTSASRFFYVPFMMLLFLIVATGCLNTEFFLKCATAIVCLASALLILQYFSHYILHHTINMRPFSLLVSQDVIWVRHAMAESTAGKLYRPAAFFLEPSHFFLYTFPILSILLLSPGMTVYRKRLAIWITMGMILTTSGFGIFASIGLWGAYFLFYAGKEDTAYTSLKTFTGKSILLVCSLILMLILAYMFVPVFHRSVARVFIASEGSSAIEGRIRLASNYVSSITGKAVLFGQSSVTGDLDFNVAGFFATYIRWGLIGLVLTYWFYGRGLWKLKRAYFWMTFIIIGISFFTAHTHGTFYMLYYVCLLMNGYKEANDDRVLRLARRT